MSIAGKIKAIERGAHTTLVLEGENGESAGQSQMFISGPGADIPKPGATIWGSGSSVEVQNPGERKRHIFDREGYTTLKFRETKLV